MSVRVTRSNPTGAKVRQDAITSEPPVKKAKMAGRGRPAKPKPAKVIDDNNTENGTVTDTKDKPVFMTILKTEEVDNTAKKLLPGKRTKTAKGRTLAKEPSTSIIKNSVDIQTTDSKNTKKKLQSVVADNNSDSDTANYSSDKEEVSAKETKLGKKGRPPKKQKSPISDDNSEIGNTAKTIYDFSVNNIKGELVPLSKYKGNVCLIVNVASRCGHTKSNYEQLVQLHKQYAEAKGLKILAFPCNQFAKQEPGSPETICKFVKKYAVEFEMFDKVNVNGPNADPLFKYLCSKLVDPKTKANTIKWNFAKFIINKEGIPVERFVSSTKPLTLVNTLEKYW